MQVICLDEYPVFVAVSVVKNGNEVGSCATEPEETGRRLCSKSGKAEARTPPQTELFRTEQRNLFSKYPDKRKQVPKGVWRFWYLFPELQTPPAAAPRTTELSPLPFPQSIEQIKMAVKAALA